MPFNFTQEQWFEIFRFAILPALFWGAKKMIIRAAIEMRDTIDERAAKVADEKDKAVIGEIKTLLDTHEQRDQERFQALHDLILTVNSSVKIHETKTT